MYMPNRRIRFQTETILSSCLMTLNIPSPLLYMGRGYPWVTTFLFLLNFNVLLCIFVVNSEEFITASYVGTARVLLLAIFPFPWDLLEKQIEITSTRRFCVFHYWKKMNLHECTYLLEKLDFFYLFLSNWLIDCNLTSSGRYFTHFGTRMFDQTNRPYSTSLKRWVRSLLC